MKLNTLKFVIMSILSAILMILAFPMTNFYIFAFIAFAPMMAIIFKNVSAKQIIISFTVFVFVFFGVLLFWVAAFMLKATPVPVAIVSLLFILVLFSFYYSLTAIIAKTLSEKFPKMRWIIAPACFTILEYMRTIGFLAFPWGLIGYSQWKFLYFIQFADLVGVLGVGFVIYFVNAVIADFSIKYQAKNYDYLKSRNFLTSNIALTFALLILIFSYGFYKLTARYHEYKIGASETKIALVQKSFDPNHIYSEIYTGQPALDNLEGIQNLATKILLNPGIFSNKEKPDWVTPNSSIIAGRITSLAREAALQKPSMTVFCEAAVEYSYQYYRPFITGNEKKIENGNPITPLYDIYLIYQSALSTDNYYLLGTPIIKPNENSVSGRDKYLYYNGALLIDKKGDVIKEYGKMKLVPFGEEYPFVENEFLKKTPPFSFLVDFLYKQLELAGTAGWNKWKDKTIFEHPDGYKFAASICFESAFGDFTRHFVRNGADMIIVMTDDAWSYKNTALWQHFSMAVFRAVENKRDTMQNANSGVSAHIDAFGNIKTILPTWKPGYAVADVKINEGMTIYTKYGEWFVLLLAVFIAALVIIIFVKFILKMIRNIVYVIRNRIHQIRINIAGKKEKKIEEKNRKKIEKQKHRLEKKKEEDKKNKPKRPEKIEPIKIKKKTKKIREKNSKSQKIEHKKEKIETPPILNIENNFYDNKAKNNNITPIEDEFTAINGAAQKSHDFDNKDFQEDYHYFPEIDTDETPDVYETLQNDTPNIADTENDLKYIDEKEISNIDFTETEHDDTADENKKDRDLFGDLPDIDKLFFEEDVGDDDNEHDKMKNNFDNEEDEEITEILNTGDIPDIEYNEDIPRLNENSQGDNILENDENKNHYDIKEESAPEFDEAQMNFDTKDQDDILDDEDEHITLSNTDDLNIDDKDVISDFKNENMPEVENEEAAFENDILTTNLDDTAASSLSEDFNEKIILDDIDNSLGANAFNFSDDADNTDNYNESREIDHDNDRGKYFGVFEENEENEIINSLPDIKDILTDAGDGTETPIYKKNKNSKQK